jgi:hypothetical protein
VAVVALRKLVQRQLAELVVKVAMELQMILRHFLIRLTAAVVVVRQVEQHREPVEPVAAHRQSHQVHQRQAQTV